MGRKLTPRELEERVIGRAIRRIKTMEKYYGKGITRSACQRYANRERESLRLQREIKQREDELNRLKKQKR